MGTHTRVELRTLGARQLIGADGRVLHTVLAQPKRLALLVYLAADRRGRLHRRDELLALLWPDLPEAKGRNALSQALSFLRRALGDPAIATVGVDEVGIDAAVVICDAVALREAAEAGEHERVLELYRGDFLAGLYVDDAPALDRWIEGERRYLRERAAESSRALAQRREHAGALADAIRLAERATALAPHDGAAVREVMRLHLAAGDRTSALRAYDAYADYVRAELELDPDPATSMFAASARTPASHRSASEGSVVAVAAAPLPGVTISPRSRAPRSRHVAVAAGALLAAGAALVSAVRWASGSDPVRPRVRFALALDDSARIPPEANGVTLALSPDASELAYVGGPGASRVFRRRFEDLVARPVLGTDNARNPSFSPDGKWLAFTAGLTLKRMPVAGGAQVTIADTVQRYSWGAGDVIVFDRAQIHASRSLWQVNAVGGTPRLLTRVDSARGETMRTWPHVLPGGEAALFVIQSDVRNVSELAVVRLSDGRVTRLGINGLHPRYVPNGFVVFGRANGTVYAVPFDVAALRVTGHVVPVLEDVLVKEGGAVDLDVAPDGTLAYSRIASARQLVTIDDAGRTRVILADRRGYLQPRFSPDGKRVAVVIRDRGTSDVWIADVASGALSRLTSSGTADRPEWSADGTHVFWREIAGARVRVMRQASDGSGPPVPFADSTQTIIPSPTGRFYAAIPARYTRERVGVVAIDTSGHAPRTLLVDGRDGPVMARLSPDGRWIAFAAGLAGQRELFVQPVPPTGVRHRVADVGSSDPVWGADSHALTYRANGKVVRATLATTPELTVTRRDTLFDDTYWHSDNSRFADYDVSRDGRFIVAVRIPGEQVRVTVVSGWADEIRARFAQP